MLTTAGLMRSAISAKLTPPAGRTGGRAARGAAGRARRPRTGAVLGVSEPATIKPTRKAAVAVSTSVTRTKRRFMSRL